MAGATEPVLSNGHTSELYIEHENNTTPPAEVDVQAIIQSIKETSSETASSPLCADLDDLDEGAYWDLSSMAPLNAVSKAAIARLRAYRPPPFPLWDTLPVSRRAAVLVLLYADRRGDLRVVLTMRAASLRSFSGHAAFPGGKADSLEESPYQIARREAWEEIGLPIDDAKIPSPFRIEHLCCLPHSLAKTELAVRPCVALLHSDDPPGRSAKPSPTVEESLMPKLDAKEVAAVFSAPLHNFLLAEDELVSEQKEEEKLLPPGKWYEGRWAEWHNHPWRVHYFYVPVTHQRVTKPKLRDGGLAAIAEQLEEEEEEAGRYMVWGMTGRMLVDTARVAYAREPEFEHNTHYGDEALIERLAGAGKLKEKKRRPEAELVPEDVKKVKDESKM
ncbi:unnamed protein product [Discula destructiva]